MLTSSLGRLEVPTTRGSLQQGFPSCSSWFPLEPAGSVVSVTSSGDAESQAQLIDSPVAPTVGQMAVRSMPAILVALIAVAGPPLVAVVLPSGTGDGWWFLAVFSLFALTGLVQYLVQPSQPRLDKGVRSGGSGRSPRSPKQGRCRWILGYGLTRQRSRAPRFRCSWCSSRSSWGSSWACSSVRKLRGRAFLAPR